MTTPDPGPRLLSRLAVTVAGGATVLALSAAPVSAQAAPNANGNPCRPVNPGTPRPDPPCRHRGRCYPIGARACSPFFNLSKEVLALHEAFTGSAGGFAPGTLITFTFTSQEQTIATATAGPDGRASVSLAVPDGVEPGRHTVRAKGTDDADGDPLVLSEDVTVTGATAVAGVTSSSGTEATTSSGFARTGMYVLPATATGLGLIAVGVGLRRSVRRKKTAAA